MHFAWTSFYLFRVVAKHIIKLFYHHQKFREKTFSGNISQLLIQGEIKKSIKNTQEGVLCERKKSV